MSTVLDDAVFEDRPEVDLSVLAASLRPEREETVVLALDIGTSGVRSGLFDSRGDEIAGSQVSLSHEFADLAGGTDSDADALINFVECALDIAVARAESLVSRIDYVACSCFWHSLVGVDSKGSAVTPCWAGPTLVPRKLSRHFDQNSVSRRRTQGPALGFIPVTGLRSCCG